MATHLGFQGETVLKTVRANAIRLLFAVLAGWPLVASSEDGILELNQAGVLASGGFPITLSVSGSYQLTSNLTLNTTVDAIAVTADDVFIDLNGFAIIGGTACSESPPPAGSGSGVVSSARGTTVENGTVRGFRAHGISLGSEGRVADVRVRCAGISGIRVGAESRIEGSAVSRSTVGVETGSTSLLIDNEVVSNSGVGMTLGAGSAMRGNVIVDNNGGNQNTQFQAPQGSFELGPNRCGASLTCTAGGTCGDGLIEAGEGCDDANILAGDGCSPACAVESGFQCVSQPSVCSLASVCGDGARTGIEQCDGTDLGGQSCFGLGFTGGDLSCSVTCVLDFSGCF
jgi:cysteine-rich repeat protein